MADSGVVPCLLSCMIGFTLSFHLKLSGLHTCVEIYGGIQIIAKIPLGQTERAQNTLLGMVSYFSLKFLPMIT